MSIPPGVDPRMFAFFQAQRQLQQGQHHQQQTQHHHPHPHPPPQQQQQQQQQQQHPQPQQHGHPHYQQGQQQRPVGESDVASILYQLKTNQNGEPVTDVDALQHHQAALNAAASRSAQHQQLQQQQMPMAAAQVVPQPSTANTATTGSIPGYPQIGMNMYNYSGILPFPQASNNFAAAAAAAIGTMSQHPQGYNPLHHQYQIAQQHQQQQQQQQHHQGLSPMQQGGVLPGLNHDQQQHQQHSGGDAGASPMHGGPGGGQSSEAGPVMTNAYIESLITENAVVKNGTASATETASSKNKNNTGNDSSETAASSNDAPESAKDDMSVALVVPEDRDLIPDALFVALGQMKPCRLQQCDRVGCYKTRALDFLGMACKHCGGQPGFGRYFPNSVRSLAQTTTSQTILKHIGGKCRFCPQNVRKAVLELQRQQAHKEHMTTGRPRYGSRKIFFQRMWARLHGPSEDGETAVVVEADVTPEQAKEEARLSALPPSRTQTTSLSKMTTSLLVPVTVITRTTTNGPTKNNRSGTKRTLISNSNTDDEDAAAATLTPCPWTKGGRSKMIGISVAIPASSSSSSQNKKRKVSDDDDAGVNENENKVSDEDKKKLRISPVAV